MATKYSKVSSSALNDKYQHMKNGKFIFVNQKVKPGNLSLPENFFSEKSTLNTQVIHSKEVKKC